MSDSVRACLREGARKLERAGKTSPALDAALLLAHALNQSRGWLYAHPEHPLTPRARARWRLGLAQRLAHRPLAYITGRKEFMGLSFQVEESVLIPRPETELLVEMALRWLEVQAPGPRIIADIGTGSGCIALALARMRPDATVIATDISASALQVARANHARQRPSGRVRFRQGHLLEALPEPVHLILANLPYVKSSEREGLAPEIRAYEPDRALWGGADGLDHIRALVNALPGHLHAGGAVILECGCDQAEAVQALLQRTRLFSTITIHPDLAGLDRCVMGWDGRT